MLGGSALSRSRRTIWHVPSRSTIWKRIVGAILELLRSEPHDGEPVN